MRVIYIDPMSYNNLSIYDRSLLNNINGNENFFFCSNKLEFDNFENTIIKKIYNYNEKRGPLKVLSYIKSQLYLFYFILFTNIDLVHVQWVKVPHFDYLLYKLLKKIIKVKIIFTAHNTLPHDTGLKYKKIYSKIYTMVDKIIVHSSKTKDELIQEFGISFEKIEIIPHGLLELESVKEIKNDRVIIKNKYEKVYSFIGHLNKYKGIDFLIDAWNNSEKLKNNKNIRLVIAGKGKVDFKGLENAKNVTIVNRFLDDYELQAVIEQTDLFILPYRKISQSGVLLSILKYRKPVVVTNEGGLTDPFECGEIGWIMKDKSSDSLGECLENISNNLNELEKIKNDDGMWEQIIKYYDWKEIGKKTKKLYENVTN